MPDKQIDEIKRASKENLEKSRKIVLDEIKKSTVRPKRDIPKDTKESIAAVDFLSKKMKTDYTKKDEKKEELEKKFPAEQTTPARKEIQPPTATLKQKQAIKETLVKEQQQRIKESVNAKKYSQPLKEQKTREGEWGVKMGAPEKYKPKAIKQIKERGETARGEEKSRLPQKKKPGRKKHLPERNISSKKATKARRIIKSILGILIFWVIAAVVLYFLFVLIFLKLV